ncbi:C40 family peptidase [Trueperella sp. LYQ143]|uniref:C40 family peptidase n=1 Tax=unclassified Trueperella TaxID=2630174 RepID=UPI003983435D
MAGRHVLIKQRETFSKQTLATIATASAAGMVMGLSAPLAFAKSTDADAAANTATTTSTHTVQAPQAVSVELNTQSDAQWTMHTVSLDAHAQQAAAKADENKDEKAQTPAATQNVDRSSLVGEAASVEVSYDSAAGGSVLGTAMAHTGSPYIWGGTTPAGWDCIGFVRWVYAQHGVAIGGSTTSVLSVGHQVPYSEAQPGDILYWPGHVAISVGGGQNVAAWNQAMGTRVGPDSWAGYTPTVIRVFG